MTEVLLFRAIIAFAAIHSSTTGAPSMRQIAERYHSQCIKLLIALNKDNVYFEDGTALAAVCLLRSYEILAEDCDPNRHLSGAYALAVDTSLGLSTPSLSRAGFFNYLREDITYSLINQCALKIDLANITIPDTALSDEDQLNIASLHLAGAINRTFGHSDLAEDRIESHRHFIKWREGLPQRFLPYFETPAGECAHTFPTIRMLRDCHVAVVQYCLVTEQLILSGPYSLARNKEQLQTNASRICGLAFSADSPPVVVNSFGPISFSCRYLSNQPLQMELIRRLQASRKETGWPVQRIVDDLEQHWLST